LFVSFAVNQVQPVAFIRQSHRLCQEIFAEFMQEEQQFFPLKARFLNAVFKRCAFAAWIFHP
jgi:hypothetical protein